MSDDRGPIEDLPWPSTLTARVVEPGPPIRLHGFAVHEDLARHFAFSDLVYLAMTGELPNDLQSRWFAVALALLSPAPVNEAPAHAAMLARLCGATTSGVIGTGAVALAEQARHLALEHNELVAWLAAPSGPLPGRFRADKDEERAQVSSALDALGGDAAIAVRHADPTLSSLLICVLFDCGLRTPERIESAICVARLPCVIAEALAVRPGDFRGYPMNLPVFHYVEPKR